MYGRRPAYIICFGIYVCANLGLALQNSYGALMALRCFQSMGSSATIALSSATVADLVTRAERGKFIGYAAMGVTLGPALGPVAGGLLTQYYGWRGIFWFLVILSGTLFVIMFTFLPETCRNIVGNGSVLPPWWNMSFYQYLKARRMTEEEKAAAAQTETVQRGKRRPNPFAALKILFEREGGVTLGCGSLLASGYFMVLDDAVRPAFRALRLLSHPGWLVLPASGLWHAIVPLDDRPPSGLELPPLGAQAGQEDRPGQAAEPRRVPDREDQAPDLHLRHLRVKRGGHSLRLGNAIPGVAGEA